MSSEQKTEYPTHKRLQDERKKGNVPFSKEFTTFIMIVGYAVILGWSIPNALKEIFLELKSFYDLSDQYVGNNYSALSISLVKKIFDSFFFIAIFLMFLSIVGNVVQTGFVLSFKSITPSLGKVSIKKGLKRLFSSKSVVETLFAAVKFAVMAIVIFIVIKGLFPVIKNLYSFDNRVLIEFIYDNLLNIFIIFTIFGAATGVLDLLYKHYVYINDLKMSKQEIKDEMRDSEGQPEVKNKLKSIRKALIKNNIRKNVKEADVIITNPTHYAVALKYDEGNMPAPKVVAKGQDLIALSIKEIAIENKISIIENQALAQSLYKAVKVGDFISEEHYVAVAEIISYIYKNR